MGQQNNNRKRATAIVVEDGNVLLIERLRNGKHYFVFPGGGVDEGETVEEALIRESAEELSVDIEQFEPLFVLENIDMPHYSTIHAAKQDYHCFLIKKYKGIPEIGGPEKASMNADNQYKLVWVPLGEIDGIRDLLPEMVAKKLATVPNLNF